MSIAEKLTAIAENEQKVYDAGKQAERAITWGILQNYGEEADYGYAFSGGRFTDGNYNPLYPIRCKANNNSSGQYMFYNAKDITSTKVPINANCNVAARMFYGCTKLVEIVELGVHEALTYTQTFDRCSSLERINITGVIGQNISFADCKKLNKASIKSIINAAARFSLITVTLSRDAVMNAFGKVVTSNRAVGTEIINGLTVVTGEDGSVTVSGTATAETTITFEFLEEATQGATQGAIWEVAIFPSNNVPAFIDFAVVGFGSQIYPSAWTYTNVMNQGDTAFGSIQINEGTTVNDFTFTPKTRILDTDEASSWGILRASKPDTTISLV